MKLKSIIITQTFVLFLIALALVGGQPDVAFTQPAQEVEVHLLAGANRTFNQTEIQVPKGAQVTVIMKSEGASHTFTINDERITTLEGKAVDLEVNQNQIANVTFVVPNEDTEIEFICTFHVAIGMKGKIIVGEGIQTTTTTTPTPGFGLELLFVMLGLSIIVLAARKRFKQ
ncbi:MAG: plastocyanin/azurin family copper-binding protein [Promethearchaeota archaeon]